MSKLDELVQHQPSPQNTCKGYLTLTAQFLIGAGEGLVLFYLGNTAIKRGNPPRQIYASDTLEEMTKKTVYRFGFDTVGFFGGLFSTGLLAMAVSPYFLLTPVITQTGDYLIEKTIGLYQKLRK